MDLYDVTGHPDDALNQIRRAFQLGSANNHNLLAIGIPPQRNMPGCEGQAHVVAEAAHDQVIADEQSIFHGLGRNYASLADAGINKKECQDDPEPRDCFAFGALSKWLWNRLFGVFFDCVIDFKIHASPGLGFMCVFMINLCALLVIVLRVVAHLKLDRRRRIIAGETRSAEAMLGIGNGGTQIIQ